MGFGDDGRASDGLGPLVGRPRGAEWRALQADGIVWEGQVLLVGDEVDLAARLVVTHRRLAFVRGGTIALEVGRSWLRPAPRLLPEGTLLLSISAPGASIFTEPETIPLWMRDGQQAVRQLIAMLAGSGARALPPGPLVAPTAPGRSRPGALPPLPPLSDRVQPDREPAARESVPGHPPTPPSRWRLDRDVDDETGYSAGYSDRALVSSTPRERREGRPRGGSPLAVAPAAESELAEPESVLVAPGEPTVRRAAAPVAVGNDRDWNLEPIKGLVPRGSRKRRGWSLRIGGLFVLLGIAAGLGVLSAGRPAPGGRDKAALAPNSTLVAPTATEAVRGRSAPAEQTALAVGVGGANAPTAGVPAPAVATSPPGDSAGGGDDETSAPDAAPTTATVEAPPAPTATAPATTAPAGEGAPIAPPTQSPDGGSPADTAVQPSATTEAPATTATEIPAPTATSVPQPTVTATAPATSAPTTTPVVTAAAQQPVAIERGATETFVRGPLRYSVERVERGATLPAFSLAGSGSSEWVAVIVSVRNWAGLPGEVDMDQFELTTTDGEPVARLDPISDTVSSFAGLGPGFGPGDVVPMPIGADERLALAFMVPPDAGELVLQVGNDVLVLEEE